MVNFTAGSVLTASALNTAFNTQTIDAQTGTTFTFGTANSGELVTLSNASGGTATIPPNSTYGAATGTVIGVMNAGTAGSFVIAAGSGVTLNAVSGTTTLAPLEAATLVKLATNTWQLSKGGGGLPKAAYSATTGSPTVTTVGGKTCVQFTGSGSITISTAGLVEVLVVGGGGGGGTGNSSASNLAGGGGAGGHLYATNVYLNSGSVTVTVGAGGSGATVNNFAGQTGNTSRLDTFYGVGGGGGGAYVNAASANNGGSGGGAGGGISAAAASQAGANGTGGQGNSGGNGGPLSTISAGGGGGGAGYTSGPGTTGGTGGSGIVIIKTNR